MGMQRLGDLAAIIINVAAVQAARQRERTRHRHFHGYGSDGSQTPIFRGQPESLRCSERCDTAVAAALIVRRRTPVSRLRQRLDAGEIIVKAEVEIDALHLAVGDEVGAGAELVVHGQAHRVAQRLLAVVRAKHLGMSGDILAEFGIPAGKRPAADHGRGKERESCHAGNLAPG